jgi:Zn-dependent M28 family amino/carboxypeptidase
MQRYSAECGGRLKVELQGFDQQPGQRVPRVTRLTNVIATLPGELPGPNAPVLVVSGHYDSMCTSPTNAVDDAPGANDDASGTAVVLELARVMSKHRFRKTIVFMAVPGEEQGLLGATYFAEQAKKAGTNIEAMFTNDIVGNSTGGNGVKDDRTIRVFSEGIPTGETAAQAAARRSVGGENDGPSRQLSRFIAEAAHKFVSGFRVAQVWRRDRYGRGGDHIPFLERGYTAVRFTEPNENYLHQHQNVRTDKGVVYGDLPEFVDFDYVARVARVNCAALAELANAPSPFNVSLVTGRLSHDTDLRWTQPDSASISGYEVVWRATDERDWSHRRKVGLVTSVTM